MKYTLPIGAKLHSPKRTYTIEKVLGQGGFGITYKVSANLKVDNVTIRTHFAIKEFFMSEACERDEHNSICYSSPVKDKVEESRKDFLAEAQRLNKISLEHPNIIHVNEVFEANNTVYYVMEYLDAGSLRDYVRKQGALSEQEALAIMVPIMQAVEYLHQHKMSHLDVKPDNVMLKEDPETGETIPVLIDFGLSKHYDKNGKPTSTVRVSGFSDGYAPVEQYTGIYFFTPQADVYALAATLYYALVGKDPVIASEQTEEKILKNLPKGISDSVKKTILSSMKMQKEERCPSVSIMLADLSASSVENVQNEQNENLTKKSNETQVIKKTHKKHSMRIAWSVAGIIGLVAVVWMAIMVFSSPAALPQQSQPQQPIEQKPSVASVASPTTMSSSSNKVGSSEPGSVIRIPVKNGISIKMVKVEAGSFDMGATPEMENPDTDEMTVHRVTLTNDYYIGRYEVTQALWQAVMGSNPSKFKGDDLPVETVNWGDCQDFISKLNAMTGKRFRLPTEAEWEYAARGGKKSRGYQYSGSNTLGDVAWYGDNSGSKTHAVGTKQPNELGIYDMTGNVWEWCQDWYDSYSSSPQTNPTRAVGGAGRVNRGGSLVDPARDCRTSFRSTIVTSDIRSSVLGLRLVLSE